MRFPISKVYRAFPELDRLTDEQCEEYVRQVCRRFRTGRQVQRVARSVMTLVFAVVSFVVCILYMMRPGRPTESVMLTHPVLGAVTIAVVTAVPSMLFFFGMNHIWLRRRIAAHMREIRCVQCHYLLLRLAVVDGAVTCPECGTRVVLETLGLTAADVMGDSEPRGASPR